MCAKNLRTDSSLPDLNYAFYTDFCRTWATLDSSPTELPTTVGLIWGYFIVYLFSFRFRFLSYPLHDNLSRKLECYQLLDISHYLVWEENFCVVT